MEQKINETKVKQKDIVLIPYPFTNLRNTKIRPALIISNDFFNEKNLDCIMVPFTSKLTYSGHSILVGKDDLSSGNMLETSIIKPHRVFAVEQRLVIKKVATARPHIIEKVKSELAEIL